MQLAKPPLFFQEIPSPPRHHPNRQTYEFADGQALISRVHEAIFPPGALDKHFKELLINDEHLAELSGMPFPTHDSVFPEPTFVDGSSSEVQHLSPPPPLADSLMSARYRAKWNPGWSDQFKWAKPIFPNGVLLVKCHVCCLNEKRGLSPFANDGAKTVNHKSLLAHGASKLHKESVELFPDVLASLPTSVVPFEGPASNIPTASRKRKVSTLYDSLSNDFPWAFFRKNSADEEHVICKYSVSFAVSAKSSFADQGGASFIHQSLAHHEDTTDHKNAVQNAPASRNAVVVGNQIDNEPAFVGGSESEAQHLEQDYETVDEETLAEALAREADAACDEDLWSMIDEYMSQTDQEDHGNELVGGGCWNIGNILEEYFSLEEIFEETMDGICGKCFRRNW
ncbi:uncharacterized protein LOC121793813 [Salvia splendens]|uniref:uncharacterized protein LOC121793813 n=1 Tax=Salvia splendens TaxID=180675 RepID=UPI001C270180|nr:uncharacterized protein LOC121793813 [Salvia splendens]